jgi:hypothetical protein
MKSKLHILLTLATCILLAACNGKEDTAARDALSASQEMGIYKDGTSVLAFSKTKHQYWCSPSEATLRILTNDGTSSTTLKLNAMPTESSKVSGEFSGNMSVTGKVTGLRVLKKDSRNVWLWSDDDKIGLILPAIGFD